VDILEILLARVIEESDGRHGEQGCSGYCMIKNDWSQFFGNLNRPSRRLFAQPVLALETNDTGSLQHYIIMVYFNATPTTRSPYNRVGIFVFTKWSSSYGGRETSTPKGVYPDDPPNFASLAGTRTVTSYVS
jgi:hypothetical protein